MELDVLLGPVFRTSLFLCYKIFRDGSGLRDLTLICFGLFKAMVIDFTRLILLKTISRHNSKGKFVLLVSLYFLRAQLTGNILLLGLFFFTSLNCNKITNHIFIDFRN